MTCRAAVRVPIAKLEGSELQIVDMKTWLEKSKRQVARSQNLINDIGPQIQPQASA